MDWTKLKPGDVDFTKLTGEDMPDSSDTAAIAAMQRLLEAQTKSRSTKKRTTTRPTKAPPKSTVRRKRKSSGTSPASSSVPAVKKLPPGVPVLHRLWDQAVLPRSKRTRMPCTNCQDLTDKMVEVTHEHGAFINGHPLIGGLLDHFCTMGCAREWNKGIDANVKIVFLTTDEARNRHALLFSEVKDG